MWITNARVVLPNQVLANGSVCIEGGRISEIGEGGHVGGNLLDARGRYLFPGLIDMHSDAIEKEAMPRPGTVWPSRLALAELDKKMAGHGITSIYHSFSFSGGLDMRGDDMVVEMIRSVRAFRRTLVRNLVHLRYEITNLRGLQVARSLISEGAVDLLSVMDHTPGQGQYTDPNQYRNYVTKTYGTRPEDAERTIRERQRLRELVDEAEVARLAALAKERGLRVASHDDDSPAKVLAQHGFGVTISEFPITMDAAHAARELGLHVAVGAPNVVRGGSHNANLRAEDAIRAGYADMLCSDYYPASILIAICRLASEGAMDLAAAARLGTANVAKAVGIDAEVGSIAVGKRADLILVDWEPGEQPLVTATMVGGRLVYSISYEENAVVAGGR